MNPKLLKSIQHGADIFSEIMLSALIVAVCAGLVISVGYGLITLGTFLAAKFAGWVAVVVCFIIIVFLLSVGAAVDKYFSKS